MKDADNKSDLSFSSGILQDFKRHDLGNKGELDYHEAMMLLEHRGSAMTAKELIDWVGATDRDHNNRITFVEWCCASFQKSYDELFTFVDEEARERAMEEAMRFGEEARKAEEEIERAQRQKELQAQLRAAALERESKLVILLMQHRRALPSLMLFFLSDGSSWNEGILRSSSRRCG